MKQKQQAVVVLLHGVWMNGLAMGYLARYLRKHFQFETRIFSYHSVSRDLTDNANSLNQFLTTLDRDVVHLLGHSMGGLVIRTLFEHYPKQADGRVVMLGTPNQGSFVAAALSRYGPGRRFLGASMAQSLDRAPNWPVLPRELGLIAGNLAMGIGRCFPGLPRPNDGTVTVSEALTGDSTDQLILPVSHTSMLFSAAIGSQIGVFLNQGRFDHGR